jgi:hypothetical protein
VVVLIVHDDSISTFKLESQSPILIDPNRPVTIQQPLQGVQPPPGPIHIRRSGSRIELTQLQPQPLGMLGLNASLGARSKEPLNAIVAEAKDHDSNVSLCDTQSNATPKNGVLKQTKLPVNSASCPQEARENRGFLGEFAIFPNGAG